MMIEGTELVIYLENGDDVCIDLSPTQTAIVVKALGLRTNGNNSISCFSDKTLEKFVKENINPLNLQQID